LYCLSGFPPRVRYFYYFSQSCIIAHHTAHFVVYPCFLTTGYSICIFCIILLCSFLPLHFFFSLPHYVLASLTDQHTIPRHTILPVNSTPTSTVPLSPPPCCLLAHAPFTSAVSFFFLFVLLSGNIELNPGPSAFTLCTLNIRFILHPLHSAALSNLIDTHNPDLFCLTETWIKPTTTAAELNCTPPHYSLISTPHNGSNKISSSGGGTAFLIREPFTLLPTPPLFQIFRHSNHLLSLYNFLFVVISLQYLSSSIFVDSF